MSTGLNCQFYEAEPGQWYYVLEDWDAPKMSWDWLDFAECFGPFESFEAANSYLHDNFANPGGFSRTEWSEDMTLGETAEKMIAGATSPQRYLRPESTTWGRW